MATYAELLQAEQDPILHNKLRVAVYIAAEMVRTESNTVTNHANRLVWAKNAYANPDIEVIRMKRAVLAQNQSATLAAIIGASDATVQTAVNAAIDVFAS
jgi:hypothetical protein